MGRRGGSPNCSWERLAWNTAEGEKAGAEEVEDAGDDEGEGDDDGETASESRDIALVLVGRGGGEVSSDLERSSGASAIIESMVRR